MHSTRFAQSQKLKQSRSETNMAPFRLPTMNIVKNKSPKSVFACHEYQWTKTFTLEKER